MVRVRITAPPHHWQIRQSIAHAVEKASGLAVEPQLERAPLGTAVSVIARAIEGVCSWPFGSRSGVLGEFMLRAVHYEIHRRPGDTAALLAEDSSLAGDTWRFAPDVLPRLCTAVAKTCEMAAEYVGGDIAFAATPPEASPVSTATVSLDRLIADLAAGRIRRLTTYVIQPADTP